MSTQFENSQSPCYKFKYLKAEHLKQIVGYKNKSGKIHFSNPGEFNDPFEIPAYMLEMSEKSYKSGIDKVLKMVEKIENGFDVFLDSYFTTIDRIIYGKVIDSIIEFPLFWYEVFDEFKEQKKILSGYPWEKLKLSQKAQADREIDNIDKKYVILSLTKVKDSLLMWSHYAESHTGAVIEFDVKHPEFNIVPKTHKPFQTIDIYSPIEDKKGTQMMGDVIYKNKGFRELLAPTQRIKMCHFYYKSSQWEYENEYRIIRQKNDSNNQTEKGALFPLPFAALKSITLGVRFGGTENSMIDEKKKQEDVKQIIDLIRSNPQLDYVDIYKKMKLIYLGEIGNKKQDIEKKKQDIEKKKQEEVKQLIDLIRSNPQLHHVDIDTAKLSRTNFNLEIKRLDPAPLRTSMIKEKT